MASASVSRPGPLASRRIVGLVGLGFDDEPADAVHQQTGADQCRGQFDGGEGGEIGHGVRRAMLAARPSARASATKRTRRLWRRSS